MSAILALPAPDQDICKIIPASSLCPHPPSVSRLRIPGFFIVQ
jgi:hypothetical protein